MGISAVDKGAAGHAFQIRSAHAGGTALNGSMPWADSQRVPPSPFTSCDQIVAIERGGLEIIFQNLIPSTGWA